jgi:dethiobiotin synthetase
MDCMGRSILFITGTDTGVGKTVLAGWLTRCLRQAGIGVAALKPVCSGGRTDARRLQAAAGGVLSLDEVNPWHFRTALAPRLAARLERRRVILAQVLAQVRRIQRRFPVVVVEGAGGLLSPLGEDFDSRDLIVALRATPIVACPNRLGAVNQALLVLEALPRGAARRAQVVLTSMKRSDAASRTNPRLLRELLGPRQVHVLPWLKPSPSRGRAPCDRPARQALRLLVRSAAGQLLPTH